MLRDHWVCLCVVFFIGRLVISALLIFTEQDDRCGNSAIQSHAPEDRYINPLAPEFFFNFSTSCI
jgi:hypothetical protein